MTTRTPLPVPPQIAAIAPDGNLTPRQRRHFLLAMVKRRQKPGTGSSHEFLRTRTAFNAWPDLRDILKGIPWALIGGVATRAYMAERMTQDMDILVHERNGKETIAHLQQAGYTSVAQSTVRGSKLRAPDGTDIDIHFAKYPWLDDALAHPTQDPAGYPVIGLPYLILLKLWATHDQDWADVTRMVSTATDEQLNEVRAVVSRFSPEDSEDLESMIYSGQREMEIPPPAEDNLLEG